MLRVFAFLLSPWYSWLVASSTLSPTWLGEKLCVPKRTVEFLITWMSFLIALMYFTCDGSWYLGSLVGE